MGTSTDGILAYGYNLGAEDALNVREVNDDGELNASWNVGSDDLVEAATRALYASIPGLPDVEYGWECEAPVKEHLGVWFESYCHVDYPMWILTTSVIRVYRGDVEEIDGAYLDTQPGDNGWNEKLAHALAVLGLTPTQEHPAWLLASDWG